MKNIDVVKRQNVYYITLNFLGGIQTLANSKKDIDVAVTEAIQAFLIASEKFGKGITKEINEI